MERRSESWCDEPVSRLWQASWIGPVTEREEQTRTLFRREFELERVTRLRCFISAERDYALFVNGTFVCRGVPPSPQYYKFYDEIDLTEHLVAGRNCLAVRVCRVGAPQTGLLLELVDESGVIVETDETWRATSETGWSVIDPLTGSFNSEFQEYFDGRLHPWGWEQSGYDDSTWETVRLYAELSDRRCPWTRMVPREIPHLAEWEVFPHRVAYTEEGLDIVSRRRAEALTVVLSVAGEPVRHSRLEGAEALCQDDGTTVLQCSTAHHHDRAFDGIYSPSVVLDFGRVVAGYLVLDVEGPSGAELQVGYVERLLNGHFNNAIEVPYADRYVLGKGRQRFQSTIWKSFRFVKIRMRGSEAPLTLHTVKARLSTYPYEETESFVSGDEALNQVFDICRYTIRLSSRDYLVDTPWRERHQWLGDNAAVVLPGIYACFGDTALPRQFLQMAAASALPSGLLPNNAESYNVIGRVTQGNQGNTIADYSLWWVQALWEYYRFTGDLSVVHALYPRVVSILQYHWRHANEFGLVGPFPTWTFIDHVFKSPARITAAYNALWYGTLAAAGAMAKAMGDGHTQTRIDESRALVAANFAEAFFDPATGVFRDGFIDGAPGAGISEHSNMAAIRWGLADVVRAREVIGHLYEQQDVSFLEANPFFCVVVLAALRRAGRMDLALALIRDRWGRRMVDVGMTSTTEEWNASGSWRGPGNSYVGIYRSLSHPWSACPAEFLVRQLAGFEILEPGCGRVRISPHAAPFDYTTRICTPHGQIEVRWENGAAHVRTPDGVAVEGA